MAPSEGMHPGHLAHHVPSGAWEASAVRDKEGEIAYICFWLLGGFRACLRVFFFLHALLLFSSERVVKQGG